MAAFPDLEATNSIVYRPSGQVKLTYPCLIYEPRRTHTSHANNFLYVAGTRFLVTILSQRPGYSNIRNMFTIPGISVSQDTSFMEADIVHDVFTVFVNVIR